MTQIHILILNYNGRALLEECLPSVVEAAERSRHACEVVVIDNESTDDSLAYLRSTWADVRIVRRENRGLCSYNSVIPELSGPVAVLLNNDIKLQGDAIDPLVAPLLEQSSPPEAACFMTAPLCWLFDGETYEGFRTAVGWRFGLVRATARFEGHESTMFTPGPTASAGAALAVDCRKFVELQGFDPVYLPGRIEDLDFAFRGRMAGYQARFVPQSVALHRGMGTFGPEFGVSGCDRLALRNTLLFQWKNLRGPQSVLRQLVGLPMRLARDVAAIPWVPRRRRGEFLRALAAALIRAPRIRWNDRPPTRTTQREAEFFRRFHPRAMSVRTRNAGTHV